MSEATQLSTATAGSIRPRVAFCLLVTLHVTVAGVGLMHWPGMDFRQTEWWQMPLVWSCLASLVSLATIWLALGRLAFGRRLTGAFVTLLGVWLVVILQLLVVIRPSERVIIPLLSIPLTTMFAVPGAMMYVVLSWLRRRRGWRFGTSGTVDESPQPVVGRQFSVRHILIWTVLAAVALGVLRVLHDTLPNGVNGRFWGEVLEMLQMVAAFVGVGVVHAIVGLTAIFCVGLRPRLWTIALAIVLAAALPALSAAWITWCGGANRQEVWGFSLPAVDHLALLSVSLVLLRLTGYRFTRQVSTRAEVVGS